MSDNLLNRYKKWKATTFTGFFFGEILECALPGFFVAVAICSIIFGAGITFYLFARLLKLILE